MSGSQSFDHMSFNASYRPEILFVVNGVLSLNASGILSFKSHEPDADFNVPVNMMKTADFSNARQGSFKLLTTDGHKYVIFCEERRFSYYNKYIALFSLASSISNATSLERVMAEALPEGVFVPSRPFEWVKVVVTGVLIVAIPVTLFGLYVAFFFHP